MKYIVRKEIRGKERCFGMVVGRLVDTPYILQGRKDKEDVAFLRLADNASREEKDKFLDVKVFGNVDFCHNLDKGAIIAVNGEFVKEKKKYKGKAREENVVLTSYIEVLTWRGRKRGTQIVGWVPEGEIDDNKEGAENAENDDFVEIDGFEEVDTDEDIPF